MLLFLVGNKLKAVSLEHNPQWKAGYSDIHVRRFHPHFSERLNCNAHFPMDPDGISRDHRAGEGIHSFFLLHMISYHLQRFAPCEHSIT